MFKVGDKVMVVDNTGDEYLYDIGDYGVVIDDKYKFKQTDPHVEVRFTYQKYRSKGQAWLVLLDQLELDTISDTPLFQVMKE